MTAITYDRDPMYSEGVRKKFKVGVDIIYKGCLVGIDRTSSGYLFDLTAAAADLVCVGIAEEGVDNSGGSAGDKSVNVLMSGEATFAIGSTNQAAVGAPVFLADNVTVTLTPGQYGIYVGVITELLSATSVRVKFDFTGLAQQGGVIPAGSTAPLRMFIGTGAFGASDTSVAVSAGGLTFVAYANAAPIGDTAMPAACGQLGFTEDGTTGGAEVAAGNVTIVRAAHGSQATKFNYVLWGH